MDGVHPAVDGPGFDGAAAFVRADCIHSMLSDVHLQLHWEFGEAVEGLSAHFGVILVEVDGRLLRTLDP